MKQYLVTGSQGGFYWYVMHDGSAAAILQHGCVFDTLEEAERAFDKALGDGEAEKVTLHEIGEDGSTMTLASALVGFRLPHGSGGCGGDGKGD